METTKMGYIGYILGSYWDHGKENGNYYNGFRLIHLSPNGLDFTLAADESRILSLVLDLHSRFQLGNSFPVSRV